MMYTHHGLQVHSNWILCLAFKFLGILRLLLLHLFLIKCSRIIGMQIEFENGETVNIIKLHRIGQIYYFLELVCFLILSLDIQICQIF